MAKLDNWMLDLDAPYEAEFPVETDYPALKKWLRYQGKGRFRIRNFMSTKPFGLFWKVRFTDADTAFWAKIKFG